MTETEKMSKTARRKNPKMPNRIDRAAAAASQLYPPLAELDHEVLASLGDFLLGQTAPPAAAGVVFLSRCFGFITPTDIEEMANLYGALDVMRTTLQTIDKVDDTKKKSAASKTQGSQKFWPGQRGYQTVEPAMSSKTGFRVR